MLCVLNNTEMIGDIILAIKKFCKQQTCVHDYKYIPDKVFMIHDRYECTKCDKCKKA